jgi:hypothetical protein
VTTSGSFVFDPSFAGLFDEALEQAGVDPSSANERHFRSAKMSANLMLIEWATADGDAMFRVANDSESKVAGDFSWDLPAGGFDVCDVVMAYNDATTYEPIRRVSRQDYLNIVDPTSTGKPSIFYVDVSVLNVYTIKFWPVLDADCTFIYDYMRFNNVIGTLAETIDLQRHWIPAFTIGLASKLAIKYNPDRVSMLMPMALASYKLARRAGSGDSQVIIQTRGFGRTGRTIRGVGNACGPTTGDT